MGCSAHMFRLIELIGASQEELVGPKDYYL